MFTQTNDFFNLPTGHEIAVTFLEIHHGKWNAAKSSVLRIIDRSRHLYAVRRVYCQAYIWLLLNEPQNKKLPQFQLTTFFHI